MDPNETNIPKIQDNMNLDLVNIHGSRSQSQSIVSESSAQEDILPKSEIDVILPSPPQRRSQVKWTVLPGLKTKRLRSASAVCNETFYIFGGTNGRRLDDAESYDPMKREWTDLPCMVTSRAGCTATVLGDKIYLFGGVESSKKNASKSCECFNTKTMEFTKLDTEMKNGRDRHASVVIGKKIYVFGGYRTRGRGECFDTETNTWTDIASMVEPRYSFGAVAIGNQIYAIGGMKELDSKGKNPCRSQYERYLETMEIYDTVSDQWTVSPERMSNRRSGCAAVKIGSTITVFGGMAANKKNQIEYIQTTETYHVEKAKWRGSFIPPLINKRTEFCAEVVGGNELLVVGGKNDSGNHDQIESCIVPDIVSKDLISNSSDTDFAIPVGNLETNIDPLRSRGCSAKLSSFEFKAVNVAKTFSDGTYFGKVTEYDPESKTWRIQYDDGDYENFERAEIIEGRKLYALEKRRKRRQKKLGTEKASTRSRKRTSNNSVSLKAPKIPKKLKPSHLQSKMKILSDKLKAKLTETQKKEKEMIGEVQKGTLKDRIEKLKQIEELVGMEKELFGSSQKGDFEARIEKIDDFMTSL